MTGRYLLRGGTVLTLGPRSQNWHRADLMIEDGRVAEVGQGIPARDSVVIEAENAIVMPGFVDAHRRATMALFRNLGGFGETASLVPLASEDVYASTLAGLVGAAEAGTTTVVDWADIPAAHVDAALRAHADSGLRTVFVHPGGYGSVAPGPLTTLAHASIDLNREALERVAGDWADARGRGVRIHARAGLDPADAGVVASLAERGLLGPDVTLIHCSHLSDADLDAVSTSGAAVALAPSTEMAGGLGSPPLQKFLDRKIEPGLGVGDERLAPGDMLSQMRVVNSVQHADYFDLKLAGKAGLPNLLTTRDVIRYATLAGAEAVGLGKVTGSLEAGKQADLVVLRTDRPNIYPINDPIGAVVWGVDSSNLDWVFVGGEPVMSEGRLVADVGAIRAMAVEARDRVLAGTSA